MTVPARFCLLAWFAMCARLYAVDIDVSKLPPSATTQVDFSRDIRPILENDCLRCHGPEKAKSKFRLDNRESALKGGENGVDILPGKSAASPLIHYVARLVPDMEMPPNDKGAPLTPQQISLLRAWIDQGAAWDKGGASNDVEFSFAPVFGGTMITGDAQKFREQTWQATGVNGGLEKFELFERASPDTKVLVTGHVLRDDYKLQLDVDRNDFGFVHSGWEEYRKYFDDVGGFDPGLFPQAPNRGDDLHLDIGRAWIDLGLTAPDLPKMVLGYEFDYRQGDESSLEWGSVGANRDTARNILPDSTSVNEGVHIVKFDLDSEIDGVAIEERFRGEFYKLSTANSNTAYGQVPQVVNEGTTYFQGANTIRLSKKVNDWFFASGGYLFSKLNADSSVNMNAPSLLQQVSAPQITLERDSNVGNLNGLFGPLDGFTISTGLQAEWTDQNGIGPGTLDEETPPPVSNSVVPFEMASRYDETAVAENLSLRYSKIPFSAVYAEAHLQQEDISQYDQFSASQDILNKAVFIQHTDYHNQMSDLRTGFDTSPWRWVSLVGQFRRYQSDSQYDSGPLIQPVATAYPTFLLDRQIITDEVEAKLVLHLSPRFKTMLSYQYEADDYDVTTRPFATFGVPISPGGALTAGEGHSGIYSINSTWTPVSRLFLSTMFSYQASTLVTANAGDAAIAPYRGNTYTALVNGTYVLNQNTDLFAGFSLSDANYSEDNFAAGLPLGIEYQRRGVQVGVTRKFGKNISAKLQYRYDYYEEPSSGGSDNFRANSIFGVVTFLFW
ncbi:MAG TPA: c-type cytochrome domain-containing protein [Verrucomicrobiae bacterium]|jgi:hypothetical protein|nr:c-type cytochrome domain-containing protein [Verrucomicrobiae bacterium]